MPCKKFVSDIDHQTHICVGCKYLKDLLPSVVCPFAMDRFGHCTPCKFEETEINEKLY